MGTRAEDLGVVRPEPQWPTLASTHAVAAASNARRIARVVSPAPKDAWQAVYESDPLAMPTQSPGWAEAVARVGSFRDVSRMYELNDGQRIVLPLFAARFPPAPLSMRQSPPAAWGFGGIIAQAGLRPEHVAAVLDDVSRGPAIRTQIRPNPLSAALWQSAAPLGWSPILRNAHVLDLAGGFSEVWSKRFKSGTRNYIRRAERAGVEIECGVSERLVGEFHALLVRSFERWARRQNEPAALARWRGLRRDPESKFQALAKLPGAKCRFWVARVHGEPAAAVLVLKDRAAHYTRGAMDDRLAGPSYATYLLQCRAIEDACKAGCRHYHMGETGGSASLAQFKSRFGAVPTAYAEYRYERLPLSSLEQNARSIVKRAIGFRDA